jgi:hypothetical protein
VSAAAAKAAAASVVVIFFMGWCLSVDPVPLHGPGN